MVHSYLNVIGHCPWPRSSLEKASVTVCQRLTSRVVSWSQLIPEEYDYDSTQDPAFVSRDQSMRIREGVDVRLRIVGLRVDAAEIVSGTGHSSAVCWGSMLWCICRDARGPCLDGDGVWRTAQRVHMLVQAWLDA